MDKSSKLYSKARRYLAGGISHENRYVNPYPIYVDKALGSRKWDIDGKEYVDFSMGSASLLLGHAHPDVVQALQQQAALGTFYANCHPLEVEWGQLIQQLMPSCEQVRFVASGTEATLLALRLARAYRKKEKVLRFEAHYHGWHDQLIRGMSAPYQDVPCPGALRAAAQSVIVCEADLAHVRAALERDPEIAAVICEVSGASWGSVPLPADFLVGLRALTEEYEVTLIFDEVITGFRWSPGGLQELIGVRPDLTTLSKVATAGLPGGAVGGCEEIMRLLDPVYVNEHKAPFVRHRGTFNGNPLVAAGAVAALKVIQTGQPQKHADEMAALARQGLSEVIKRRQVNGCVYGVSSTFQIFFGKTSIDGLKPGQIRGAPKQQVGMLQREFRARGVDLMSYMGGVTSSAHTEADIEHLLTAFDAVIQQMIQQNQIETI